MPRTVALFLSTPQNKLEFLILQMVAHPPLTILQIQTWEADVDQFLKMEKSS